jgi:membrane protease YdiL (CAAX protease family)
MKQTFLTILALAFYFSMKLILPSLPKETGDWVIQILVSCVYIVLGLYILVGSASTKDSNIDLLSVFLLILFGTVFHFDEIADTALSILFKMVFWFISSLLVIKIVRGEILLTPPSNDSIVWVSIGLVSGILLAVLLAYITVNKPDFQMGHVDISQYTSLNFIVRYIAYQCSNIAIPEEFAFRGLLWGYLRGLLNGDENKASLIQGLIFWFLHFDRIFLSPMSFWIIIPISTLLLTLLGRFSRSVSASVAAHTVLNTFHVVFAIVMAST